jgi:hypothetical protein
MQLENKYTLVCVCVGGGGVLAVTMEDVPMHSEDFDSHCVHVKLRGCEIRMAVIRTLSSGLRYLARLFSF